MLSVLLAVLAAAANATSSVLQRKANLREVQAHRTGLASLVDLLRQRLWLAGIGTVIVSFLLQAAALATGELAEVQPLLSLELPLTLLLASFVFHRPLGRRTWGDIGVMTGGIALFLFALRPSPPAASDQPSGPALAWGAGATAGVLLLLVGLAYLSAGPRRAALLGVAAGVAFALTAVFMSVTLAHGLSWALFSRPELYLVAVAGIAAMVLLQEAFQAGSLVAVQPGVTLSDPVVSVLLGVLLFHEHVRAGGWILAEVTGAVAVGWGAVQLSRSQAAQSHHQDRAVRAGGREPSGDPGRACSDPGGGG